MKIEAHHRNGQPAFVEFMHITSLEEAQEIAARFPKSLKVRGTTHTAWVREGAEMRRLDGGCVIARISLAPNKTTGERNETGIKRYRSIVRHLDRMGIELEWGTMYTTSYATREQFEAALDS